MNATPHTCELCGGSSFSPLSERDRNGKPLRTVICEGCGLVMHDPVPSEEEVADYYARRYRLDYHGERVPSARRVWRAWKNGRRIHALLRPHLTGTERILEVGAGLGCTVKVFDLHGFDARGIEPNQDFNRYSREQLHARVENRNLYDLEPAPVADLILLVHVIEHFSSPRRALRHLHALLDDGGRLYVECPNLTGPFATFSRMFHFAHIYNFTPETLTALAECCGFRLEHRFSREGDPDIALLFRKDEARNERRAIPDHARAVRERLRRMAAPLRYHLRPSYWLRRIRKLAGYAWEWLAGPWLVRRLIRRLAEPDRPSV